MRRECRISRALERLSANTSGNADFLMSRKPVGPSILSMTQQNADRREEPSTVSSRAGAEQPFFDIRFKGSVSPENVVQAYYVLIALECVSAIKLGGDQYCLSLGRQGSVEACRELSPWCQCSPAKLNPQRGHLSSGNTRKMKHDQWFARCRCRECGRANSQDTGL